jgi:hypothetical protein
MKMVRIAYKSGYEAYKADTQRWNEKMQDAVLE